MGQVRPLIGRDDAEQLAAHIMKDQLSAREVERLIKAGRQKPEKPVQAVEKSADIKALETGHEQSWVWLCGLTGMNVLKKARSS